MWGREVKSISSIQIFHCCGCFEMESLFALTLISWSSCPQPPEQLLWELLSDWSMYGC